MIDAVLPSWLDDNICLPPVGSNEKGNGTSELDATLDDKWRLP